MLKSLGPVYYLVVVLEITLWLGLLSMGWTKLVRARRAADKTPRLLRALERSDVRFWPKNRIAHVGLPMTTRSVKSRSSRVYT